MDKSFYENLITEAKKCGIKRYVVGAIIAENRKVLLLERPKEDFMGGIYELPSGKVEEEEPLDQALYREVKEETNLDVEKIENYLGCFDYESKSGKKTRQFNFVVSVKKPMEIKLSEHTNYAWADENSLQKYPVTDSVKRLLTLFWAK